MFGTDGVRGVANRDLTPDLALALGRAAGLVLVAGGGEVYVGRDTRISGPMLEGALVAGLCSAGVDVRRVGVVPTPAVAFLTVDAGGCAGSMVSASHNPVADNGIKFFTSDGFKIPVEIEIEIEEVLEHPGSDLPQGTSVGSAVDDPGAVERYARHLLGSVDDLAGTKVVLDCAFGSAWELAPRVFREAGAEVVAIHDEPDGARINVDCGSTSLGKLSERVKHEGADLGLAFDGDADRVLACDEHGVTVDGDQILALAALRMHELGTLKNEIVVATVMTNLGFRRALEAKGIEVVAAPVGDRHVVEEMVQRDASLGGEQSGHVIFSQHATTGDGILTALQIAASVSGSGRPLSDLARVFERVPQVLINVTVADRDKLEEAKGLWDEVLAVREGFGDEGRVLLRPSGTEPMVRVMVEHVDEETARRSARSLADAVSRALG